MRSLAPYTLTVGAADVGVGTKGEPLHVAIWFDVSAQTSAGPKSDRFVVWYVVETGEYLLGCRVHWWLGMDDS